MPVQIGAQSHSFSDPTGLLSDCHRRIEMFLRALERVASVIDRPLTEDIRTAMESALRYFREDAPKHTADEEMSLFPRMRQIHRPAIENAMARIDLLVSRILTHRVCTLFSAYCRPCPGFDFARPITPARLGCTRA